MTPRRTAPSTDRRPVIHTDVSRSGAASTQMSNAVQIGARLRKSRLLRGLSIEQVASSTGLTKGFISQLERDLTSASVASLIRICEAVGISVGSLFEPSRTDLVRALQAPPINFGGENVVEHLLTPANSRNLQVIRSDIAPLGGSGGEPYTLNGDAEVAHVLQGRLDLTVGTEQFRLQRGDTLTFSPRESHSWHNPSSTRRSIVIWILNPTPW